MDFKSRYRYNTETDLLGKGGFARVYKAYDTLLDREVAIKVFNVAESNRGSVLNEIRKAIKLSHPNLLSYFDVQLLENVNAFGETEKIEIGVMEYANFGDLKNFVRQNKDKATLIRLLREVLLGLSYLHSKGIIHRDLTPRNILLTKEQNTITAKICDFGISKIVDNDAASDSSLMGTIEYMAPEQFEPRKFGIDGRISTNLDIWAFGIMLFELLTDKKPFGQRSGETSAEQIMQRILSTQLPPSINTIPEPFNTVIRKCLVADAKLRASTCEELIPLLGNGTVTAGSSFANRASSDEETLVFDKNELLKSVQDTSVSGKSPRPKTGPVPRVPEKIELTTEREEEGTKTEAENKEEGKSKRSNLPLVIMGILILCLSGVAGFLFLKQNNDVAPGSDGSDPFQSVLAAYNKDSVEGLAKMKDLSDHGNNNASCFVGDYFWNAQVYDSAFHYYKALSAKGDPRRDSRIGNIYLMGRGSVPKDDRQAMPLLQKAAAVNTADTMAFNGLTYLYQTGTGGMPADKTETFNWATKSAVCGSLLGAKNLAKLYYSDKKDYAQALKWFQKVAEANNPEAKRYIGMIYKYGGNGVTANPELAARYLKEAADQGDEKAAELLRSN